jgi:AraC family transcriptional regulator, arabinose operon regulatory protein
VNKPSSQDLAENLSRDLQNLYLTLRAVPACTGSASTYAGSVYCGLETRVDPREYYWDGRKRGGHPKYPYVIWQYTLNGWGSLKTERAVHRLEGGTAFTTIVPSDDIYWLPKKSTEWTFFWFIIHHPYVVDRMRKRQKLASQVWPVRPDSALIGRAVDLYTSVRSAARQDDFTEESFLFAFMLEYERLGHSLLHPAEARERLLTELRTEILSAMRRGGPTVEQLAAKRKMSRTAFSHQFRDVTGSTPAQFITRVKLAEVTRMLVQTDLKLSAIAELTGFADATHLGKVFRKRYFLTPDRYRRVNSPR